MHMRATKHFHRDLLLGTTRIKRKEIQRNTLKYFWNFCFSKENKTKMRKTIYTGKLPTSKRRMGNLFGFSF